MEIKNRNQIIEELAGIMLQADLDHNNYQTDIYLYLSEDGTATLDEYINVGGNSWLNDDHYLLWIDKPHYEDIDPTATREEREDYLREMLWSDYYLPYSEHLLSYLEDDISEDIGA